MDEKHGEPGETIKLLDLKVSSYLIFGSDVMSRKVIWCKGCLVLYLEGGRLSFIWIFRGKRGVHVVLLHQQTS